MGWLAGALDLLAALMLAALPAALLFWLLIHPFVRFWRRLGPTATYTVVAAVSLTVAYAIWTVREPLMRVHFGYRPLTIGAGVVLYLLAAAWDLRVLRKLGLRGLTGVPELSERSAGPLLTDGPYAVVRHPRYLGATLGITGFALICNYPALYLLLLLAVPAGWLLMVVEERELRQRFGSRYDDYCARVPRFIPRLGTGH